MYRGLHDINARFQNVDNNAEVLKLGFNGVLAWAIVKERVWLSALATLAGSSYAEGDRPRHSAVWQTFCNKIRHLVCAGRILTNGLCLGYRIAFSRFSARTVMIYDRRLQLEPATGKPNFHPILGEVTSWGKLQPLHIYWGQFDNIPIYPQKDCIDDLPIDWMIALSANFICLHPEIRKVSATLAGLIHAEFPHLSLKDMQRLIQNQTARFWLRRHIYARIFKRSGIKQIVLLDADAKVAEIAAAKLAEISVTEIQHGMFGSEDPEYAWKREHRYVPLILPLADRVAVFGPYWKEQLLKNGYWTERDVFIVPHPSMQSKRSALDALEENSKDKRTTILFLSQPTFCESAAHLWRQIANTYPELARELKLIVKLHPAETDIPNAYNSLRVDWPGDMVIIEGKKDLLSVIEKRCIVTGYTSFALIEALGAGLQVISLGIDNRVESLGKAFGTDELDKYIPFCASTADLAGMLKKWCSATPQYPDREWDSVNQDREKYARIARRFFASSPLLMQDILFFNEDQ